MAMREELAKREGQRKKFRGKFMRMGKKINYNGYSETTLLIENIIDIETNQMVADHIWFSYSKGFQELVLKEGVNIEFEARIKEYKKGYVNKQYGINHRSSDYKLSHPTKIKIVLA